MISEKYRPKRWEDFVGQPVIAEIAAACREPDLFEYGGERWLAASATCSSVICGFFPPKPLGLGGQEIHRHSRRQPVANQTSVRSHLERAEPGLLLGPAEPFLDVPPRECHLEHLGHRRERRSAQGRRWRVGKEPRSNELG